MHGDRRISGINLHGYLNLTWKTANEKPIQQKRKILRRPMIACQTTEFGAGLLRMTSFMPCPYLNLTRMGEDRSLWSLENPGYRPLPV
jgi:hypothetical protein